MGGDKKGADKPLSSYDVLKPFHASIAQWRSDGATFREIADRLQSSAGLSANHSAVDRYCRKENLFPEPRKKLPATSADIVSNKGMTSRSQRPAAKRNSVKESQPAAEKTSIAQPIGPPDRKSAPTETNDVSSDQGRQSPTDAPSTASSEQAHRNSRANKTQTTDVRKTYSANRPEREQAPADDQLPLFEAKKSVSSKDDSHKGSNRTPSAIEIADSLIADSGAAPPQQVTPATSEEVSVDPSVSTDSTPVPASPAIHEQTTQIPAATNPAAWDGSAALDRFLSEQIPLLMTLADSPKDFQSSVAGILSFLDMARASAPPDQQVVMNNTIEEIKKFLDYYNPENLKKRSFLTRTRDWLVWQARAGQYRRFLAAQKAASTPPATEPVPVRTSEPSLPDRQPPPPRLFVPLRKGLFWEKDLELVGFNGGADRFTVADACEGIAIFGSTGSGKTSGSGQTFACSYLNSGFGGLVLTAKVDECALWERYAERTDRTPQLCIVRPNGPFKFNFLDYQSRLPEAQGGSTENVVELLMAILEAYARFKPNRSSEGFWQLTVRELLRNLVRVFRGAGETLRLDRFRNFVAEAPQSQNAVRGPFFHKLLEEAYNRALGTRNEEMLDQSVAYWTNDFPKLNPKTRSIVITHLTSMIDLFFEPTISELFCNETTLIPEAVFDGALIVVDLPVEGYQSIGRLAAIIFKHFFQLAVSRRNDTNDASRRPVLLWVDEAQNFTTEHDSIFQATARGSRAATVYLTQNISNYYAQSGGDKDRVNGFFSNLNTKIFHSNNDPATNHWAAEMIGKAMKYRASVTTRDGQQSGKFSFWKMVQPPESSVSTSQQMDYEVQPADFGKLRTGGIHPKRPQDNLMVDAYLMKSGAQFSNGKNFFKTTFSQG